MTSAIRGSASKAESRRVYINDAKTRKTKKQPSPMSNEKSLTVSDIEAQAGEIYL
jgi:hypothetical protein